MKNEKRQWEEICTTSDTERIAQIIKQLEDDGEECKLERIPEDDDE